MTIGSDYFDQLQESANTMRMHIPATVSQAVADKIYSAKSRSDFELPRYITYANSIDETKFESITHISRVKVSGWQLEIVRAYKKQMNEEIVLAIIKKVGVRSRKYDSKDHRNGNNSVRIQLTRK